MTSKKPAAKRAKPPTQTDLKYLAWKEEQEASKKKSPKQK